MDSFGICTVLSLTAEYPPPPPPPPPNTHTYSDLEVKVMDFEIWGFVKVFNSDNLLSI